MQIMRKKLITAIITATLLIAGCSDTANVSEGQDRMMVAVEHYDNNYWIWRDKETGVMYISAGFNFTVMVNADGTPKIWQGEE